MEKIERQEKYDKQTSELYQVIGRCSVKFEHVALAMQQAILFLLQKGGLKNQQLANVVLADMTAYPLKSIFQAMIPESSQLSAEEQNICDKIFARTQRLIEKRNDIIHSTWFIGWASPNDTDFSEVTGLKQSRGKRGSELKTTKHTVAEFEAFAQECDAVESLLLRLSGCVTNDFPIAKNFLLDVKGNVKAKIGTASSP